MAPINDPITGKVLVDVLKDMIDAVRRTGMRASYTFNGIELFADPTTTMEALADQYQRKYQDSLEHPQTPPVSTTPPVFQELENWDHRLTAGA